MCVLFADSQCMFTYNVLKRPRSCFRALELVISSEHWIPLLKSTLVGEKRQDFQRFSKLPFCPGHGTLKNFPDFPSLNFIAIFVTLSQLIKGTYCSTLEAYVNIVRASRLVLPAQLEHVHQ